MDAAERQLAARERRYRLVLIGGAALSLAVALGVCASFCGGGASVWWQPEASTRVVIAITGSLERIAGMPMPADAVLIRHTLREAGGVFEYTTQHTPEQLFRFYSYLMVQVGGWRMGSQALVTEDRAEFRFYLNNLPRLTIVKARCAAGTCTVTVDY